MKDLKFLRGILAKTEALKNGVVSWASERVDATGTNHWTEVCVSDADFYFNDAQFKRWREVWHSVAHKRGLRLIFAFCPPDEQRLAKLANENNLLMNLGAQT